MKAFQEQKGSEVCPKDVDLHLQLVTIRLDQTPAPDLFHWLTADSGWCFILCSWFYFTQICISRWKSANNNKNCTNSVSREVPVGDQGNQAGI